MAVGNSEYYSNWCNGFKRLGCKILSWPDKKLLKYEACLVMICAIGSQILLTKSEGLLWFVLMNIIPILYITFYNHNPYMFPKKTPRLS